MGKLYTNEEILKSEGLMHVVTGLAKLVEEENMNPHEAYECLDSIESTIWEALNQIQLEKEVGISNE
ncbi:hypothetical protein CEY02_20600 [Bacillus pumilus]|uniref:Phage protein n=1 Tax=Bacillus pumilus TaxID=1408 RepID=A0A2A5IDW3_BACPU|nr:hypothetical protein [Bacillus pumilus]PCK15518.1 hypothetical protein CEY02_20600 [Bacillus pumilus]